MSSFFSVYEKQKLAFYLKCHLDEEDDEEDILFLLLAQVLKANNKQNKRYWIHPFFSKQTRVAYNMY